MIPSSSDKSPASHKVVALVHKLAAGLDPSVRPVITTADDNSPGWIKYVAMLTGALAALTGFLTVRTTTLTNQAIYESNQAILSQTQASDAWAEYQADSIKAHIVEMQLLPSSTLSAQDRATLTQIDTALRERQPKNKLSATDKAKEREEHLNKGMKRLAQKDMLDYAAVTVQLGIALASVAAMTRKRPLLLIGALAGGVGIIITAYALLTGLLPAA